MIKKMIMLDWRAMKYYQIRGLILLPFAFLVGVVYSPIMVIPLLVFLGLSFSINPFAVEEKGELNHLYLTLPIERKQIVIGRFALSLIIVFIAAIIIGIPVMVLSNMVAFSKYYIGAKGVIVILAISFFMYSILNLSMFPILFKLGYQKGKIWGFYTPALLVSVVFAAYYTTTLLHGNKTFTINMIVYISNHLAVISGAFIILGIALLFASFKLSVRFYSKRNF